MGKSRRISVTYNLQEAVKYVKKAMKLLPEGKEQETASGALKFLEDTIVKGVSQTTGGKPCPPNIFLKAPPPGG